MSELDDAHDRLEKCGADPELVALTRQCLLAAPALRPKSAEVVAGRIHDYLAQAEAMIHNAQVAAAEERVRASAARSRQKLAFGLVGVVLLGLAGSLPSHRADGTLEVTAELGLVFTLLPGGTFLMGAQGSDPDGPNYDPGTFGNEGPVHSVTLAPFLVSRYEMTQAQWARLSGGEFPSWHSIGNELTGDPAPAGPTHPVESVSWPMCDTLLARHGLVLPTEAQWEYGCRGGTSTPWSTGATPDTLTGYANVVDRTAVRFYPSWGVAESFDDGWSGSAPVG